jgi:hypothetical protein
VKDLNELSAAYLQLLKFAAAAASTAAAAATAVVAAAVTAAHIIAEPLCCLPAAAQVSLTPENLHRHASRLYVQSTQANIEEKQHGGM